MRKTFIYLLCGTTFLAGCQGGTTDLDKANRLMRSHVASDVEINIEPNTEKVFPGKGDKAAVCGRAQVKQAGLGFDKSQRFIILANNSFDRGFARFDASDVKKEDSEFNELWSKRCEDYVLPSLPQSAAGVQVAEKRKNFDGKADHLPKDAVFDNAWEISDLLDKLPRLKGEFEKKDAYQKRLSQLSSAKLYDDVKLDGTFAFIVDKERAMFSYDPDKEVMTYKTYNFSSGIKISEKELDSSTTERFYGQSAESWRTFYKEKQFKDVYFKEDVSIVLPKTGQNEIQDLVVRIKLSPEKAAQLKSRLSVLFVGRIRPPYLEFSTDLPERYDNNYLVLHKLIPFKLDGVWLIDTSTGEVISKSYKLEAI